MTLKSITFVQNHKIIEHFYYNNAYLDDIFHFVSARNSSLRKQISCVKIKGAIIIHVKFSGARKLKILRCFRTLYVQILSGFKNWDIQDLTLRRYDTLKVVDEISLNFGELFIIGKYIKIRFKNRRPPH